MGLTTTQAVNLFFRQVKIRKGIPFQVEIPNKETLQAFKDSEEGKGLTECKNMYKKNHQPAWYLMLTPVYTNQFEKDLKKMLRRGKDAETLKR